MPSLIGQLTRLRQTQEELLNKLATAIERKPEEHAALARAGP
jgi:hypothetical protein